MSAAEEKLRGLVAANGGVLVLDDTPSTERRSQAVAIQKLCRDEAYKLYYVQVTQRGTDKKINIRTFCAPGTLYREALVAASERMGLV